MIIVIAASCPKVILKCFIMAPKPRYTSSIIRTTIASSLIGVSSFSPIELINKYEECGSSILGVQSVDKKDLNKYGIMILKNEEEKENSFFKLKELLKSLLLKMHHQIKLY